MATTQPKTIVGGMEEKSVTSEKRTGRFLFFFKTEWWEQVSETSIGNDIHIKTDRPIRYIYLNGNRLNK